MRKTLAAVLVALFGLPLLSACVEPRPTYQINCGTPPGQHGDINVLGNQKQAP